MITRFLLSLPLLSPLLAFAADAPWSDDFGTKIRWNFSLAILAIMVLLVWLYRKSTNRLERDMREWEREQRLRFAPSASGIAPPMNTRRDQIPLEFEGDTIPIDDGFPETIALDDAQATTPGALMVKGLPEIDD
jgi:hypothetical protein